MSKELLLVGSLPFDSTQEVIERTRELGTYLVGLPDGETGERRFWTPYLPLRTFAPHPDLIEVSRPGWAAYLEAGHTESPVDGNVEEHWPFRIKPGVTSLRFDSLHYAQPSIESYREFKAARDRGEFPADLRFQVGIPSTDSVIEDYFTDRADWPLAKRAYQEAAFREVEEMLAEIPAEDLIIQWDLAVEPVNLETHVNPWLAETVEGADHADETFDDKYARHMSTIKPLWTGVPEPVALGYHWCYGTWGGWPMTELKNLELCVRMANDVVADVGRSVQYVHMPVAADADDDFFVALKDLKIGDAKLYLGLIHHDDADPNAFKRRLEAARKAIGDDFGIAGVCGFGRLRHSQGEAVMASHRADVKTLLEAS